MNTTPEIYAKAGTESWHLVGLRNGHSLIIEGPDARHKFDIGLASSLSPGYRTRELLIEHQKIMAEPCCECGGCISLNYSSDRIKPMQEHKHCFHCNFWHGYWLKRNDPHSVRVKGCHYWFHPRQGGRKDFLGFGGRDWLIHFFDGRVLSTNNLWCQGTISPWWKDRLPDNAQFAPTPTDLAQNLIGNPEIYRVG